MNKAIITGGTGYIGSNLARHLLNRGWKISIISRINSDLEYIKDIKEKISIYYYNNDVNDLCYYFSKFKPDVIFHLAAYIKNEHKINDIFNLIDSNIKLGTCILEAMKYAKINFLVNTGTYWQHYNNQTYNPVNLYAATKEAFEKIIELYVELYNIKTVTLKLFDVYGPGDKREKLLSTLKKYTIKNIKPLEVSPGEQKLDLVYIDDVVKAYEEAFNYLNKNKNSHIHKKFAVCTGELYSLKEVVEKYEKIIGCDVRINWGGKPYREREIMLPWSNYEKLPNWHPEFSLEEGLKKMIRKEIFSR
jgi:nucleoside-diphosphate-sugar epimerase